MTNEDWRLEDAYNEIDDLTSILHSMDAALVVKNKFLNSLRARDKGFCERCGHVYFSDEELKFAIEATWTKAI